MKRKARAESVGNIPFKFYNGELYHLVVTYDRERTDHVGRLEAQEVIGLRAFTSARSASCLEG
jgi:hypothetical protein